MAKWHRPKGLTLPELLVLLVVLVLAVGVLVPLLARRGGVAYRMTCGSNLAGIGKSILLYSNDYQDESPRAGGRDAAWGRTPDWQAPDRFRAYAMQPDGAGGVASISASLYLLVKYEEVTPIRFLCGGSRETREKGVSEFKLGTYRLRNKGSELIDLWDFGPDPAKHCSYAYQMVYAPYKLTVSPSDPATAIAGDRNPWMDAPAAKARDFSLFMPDTRSFNGTSEPAKQGNTSRHKGDGQNVMFLDTHVTFERRPYCGWEDDNIYTPWDGTDKVRGTAPKLGSQPADAKDSLLVNDPPDARK